jgi:hypothetical protein
MRRQADYLVALLIQLGLDAVIAGEGRCVGIATIPDLVGNLLGEGVTSGRTQTIVMLAPHTDRGLTDHGSSPGIWESVP